jgi:predicted NBD/HSP70 family sugar kinase
MNVLPQARLRGKCLNRPKRDALLVLSVQMLVSAVNFFNPSHVFIVGGITRNGPLFLAVVRQSVCHRSVALSTHHREIQYAPLGECAGLIGAGVLAMQESLKLRGSAR